MPTLADPFTDYMCTDDPDRYTAPHPEVTLEWLTSLPEELKDKALLRFYRLVESKPTPVEAFALIQVLYRTISGNTFTESAESVATRTGCDRKTVLKGLSLAVDQGILEKNERPGTSAEYSFKPVEEWLPEPVRKTDIRTNKVLESLSIQACTQPEEEDGVVLETDDPQTDTNTVVVSLKDLEEQQQEVTTPVKDSPWKYVGQGIGRVYCPPELDGDTGNKIEVIHEETKEPRQIIIKRAVDLLYKQVSLQPNFIDDKPSRVLPQRVGAIINPLPTPGIPEDVFIALQAAGIELGLGTAERLWNKYQDKFEAAITYTVAQDKAGKIKQSKEGFFRRSLEQGWNFNMEPKEVVTVARVDPPTSKEPTDEEMKLIDNAIASGRAKDKYFGDLGLLVILPSGHPLPWREFLLWCEKASLPRS